MSVELGGYRLLLIIALLYNLCKNRSHESRHMLGDILTVTVNDVICRSRALHTRICELSKADGNEFGKLRLRVTYIGYSTGDI